jgi:hypothetical protein
MDRSLPPSWRCRLAVAVDTLKQQPPREAFRQISENRVALQALFGIRAPDMSHNFGLGSYARDWNDRFGEYFEMIDRLTIEALAEPVQVHRDRLAQNGVKLSSEKIKLEQGIFTHRRDGWNIPPHSHQLAQVIQTLIYFPLPQSSEQQGTMLCRLKQPKTISAEEYHTTRYFDWNDTEPVAMMPYRANQLFSFVNTPEAIHSSNNTVSGPARRYVFSCMTAPVELGIGQIQVG